MKEYHITIRAGRLFFLGLGGIAVTGILVVAFLLYLFIGNDPLDLIKIKVKLEKQQIKARLEGSFPVVTAIDQQFSIPVKDTISVHFPFNQQINIPFNKTLNVPVELNTTIPVSMTVPFKSDIPVDTEIYMDTEIRTSVLGVPFKVPIKGYVPVHTTIPVSQKVEVQEDFHLKLRSPVKVDINDTFRIPVNTTISVNVPIDTKINLPFKENIFANVSLKGPDKGDAIPNLYILDNSLDVNIEKMRIDWRGMDSKKDN
ncbi:MAG: hypothetical protein SWH61_16175 [Thermodesulfobacteriota bacterium]|nr:hypothetical protein [Thermodesulfobacteriota bacterium]